MSATTPPRTPRPESAERYALIHPGRAAVAGAALLVLAVAIAVAVKRDPAPFAIDGQWADAMTALRGAWLTFVAERVFDPLGRFPLSWVIVAIAGVILWRQRRRGAALVLLVGELASWLANSFIKSFVDRPRPPGALIEASRSSFPSGHAAFAAVTAVLFVGLLAPSGRRAGPVLLAAGLVAAMAWSRTYLLVHWLTDVAGGVCVGLGVGLLTLANMGTAADRTD